jgi:catechol 2,3-dioxygenase-like lactoylglutathione lyase family enzyme
MENAKASNTPAYPRAVNHVGVGVADIERAIRWYGEVLGFTLLREPLEIRAADPGSNVHDVLGQDCHALLQAHMVSVNGIGIELFQLLDPPHERRDPSLEYWKSGFFHICVTDPISKDLLGASHPPVAASDQKSGGLTPQLTNTGCATAKILLATSLRSTPTITRLCTAG